MTEQATKPTEAGISSNLNDLEAARIIGIAPITLRQWRSHGKGPKYLRIGGKCVRYRRSDIESWLDGQVVDPSTKSKARG